MIKQTLCIFFYFLLLNSTIADVKINPKDIKPNTVNEFEFGCLDGLSTNIQYQINLITNNGSPVEVARWNLASTNASSWTNWAFLWTNRIGFMNLWTNQYQNWSNAWLWVHDTSNGIAYLFTRTNLWNQSISNSTSWTNSDFYGLNVGTNLTNIPNWIQVTNFVLHNSETNSWSWIQENSNGIAFLFTRTNAYEQAVLDSQFSTNWIYSNYDILSVITQNWFWSTNTLVWCSNNIINISNSWYGSIAYKITDNDTNSWYQAFQDANYSTNLLSIYESQTNFWATNWLLAGDIYSNSNNVFIGSNSINSLDVTNNLTVKGVFVLTNYNEIDPIWSGVSNQYAFTNWVDLIYYPRSNPSNYIFTESLFTNWADTNTIFQDSTNTAFQEAKNLTNGYWPLVEGTNWVSTNFAILAANNNYFLNTTQTVFDIMFLEDGRIRDFNSLLSINPVGRTLLSDSENITLNWQDCLGFDSVGIETIDWTGGLLSKDGYISVDWFGRQLYATNEGNTFVSLNWQTLALSSNWTVNGDFIAGSNGVAASVTAATNEAIMIADSHLTFATNSISLEIKPIAEYGSNTANYASNWISLNSNSLMVVTGNWNWATSLLVNIDTHTNFWESCCIASSNWLKESTGQVAWATNTIAIYEELTNLWSLAAESTNQIISATNTAYLEIKPIAEYGSNTANYASNWISLNSNSLMVVTGNWNWATSLLVNIDTHTNFWESCCIASSNWLKESTGQVAWATNTIAIYEELTNLWSLAAESTNQIISATNTAYLEIKPIAVAGSNVAYNMNNITNEFAKTNEFRNLELSGSNNINIITVTNTLYVSEQASDIPIKIGLRALNPNVTKITCSYLQSDVTFGDNICLGYVRRPGGISGIFNLFYNPIAATYETNTCWDTLNDNAWMGQLEQVTNKVSEIAATTNRYWSWGYTQYMPTNSGDNIASCFTTNLSYCGFAGGVLESGSVVYDIYLRAPGSATRTYTTVITGITVNTTFDLQTVNVSVPAGYFIGIVITNVSNATNFEPVLLLRN
jgi:hypothetical protein